MIPTPVAQNIIGSVRQALDLVRSSVQDSEHFDPLHSDKRFRISANDLTEAIQIPTAHSVAEASRAQNRARVLPGQAARPQY